MRPEEGLDEWGMEEGEIKEEIVDDSEIEDGEVREEVVDGGATTDPSGEDQRPTTGTLSEMSSSDTHGVIITKLEVRPDERIQECQMDERETREGFVGASATTGGGDGRRWEPVEVDNESETDSDDSDELIITVLEEKNLEESSGDGTRVGWRAVGTQTATGPLEDLFTRLDDIVWSCGI